MRVSRFALSSAIVVASLGLLAAGTPSASHAVAAGRGVSSSFARAKPPADIAAAYADSPIPITVSAYAHFKKVKGPYVVGFANSNMGNSWRAQSLKNLETMFAKYKAKGIVSKLITANANNSVTTQIAQIQDMIAEKVNLILINAASETGLNPVIEKAYKAGIVVVAFNNIVSSPYAENRDISQSAFGSSMMQGLVNILHGRGNIVMVEGIPGAAGSTIRENAAEAVLKKYPNIHVIANVTGDWTETGAKTAMLNVLATHPEAINGVWQQGGMTIGVEQALKQDGRPIVPITMTGMNNGIDFWVSHLRTGYKTVGSMDPPGGSAVALRVGIRILEGQHPRLNAIFTSPPLITNATVRKYYHPKASPTSWVDPATYNYVSSAYLSKFFINPKPTL